MSREETAKTLHKERFANALRKLLHSRKALAVPVTYLILFVSLMAIVSATYSLAVVKIGARGAMLKASVAKQNMLTLDDAIRSVAWSYGASQVVYMDDCGGNFQTQPTARNLVLNFTDEQSFQNIMFNSSIGEAFYELEPSESNYYGLFVRGDERAIINESASTMTQIYIALGSQKQKMNLSYRPSATSIVTGTGNGKPLNLVRVNIVSLNSSPYETLGGKFYLKVTASDVTTVSTQYELNQSVSSLAVKATLGDTQTTVWLPISSNAQGAVVDLEIVVSSVGVQEAEM